MSENDGFATVLEFVDLRWVLVASFIEKFVPVVPSYVLFPTVGMTANALDDLVARCIVATAGSVAGAAAWYLFGHAIGPRRARTLVGRYGRWIFLTSKLYEQLAQGYQRRPFVITLLGQLVPTVRIYQALPAGVLRLPLLTFLLATGAGAFCWISLLAGAGYLLRQSGWSASETGLAMIVFVLAAEVLALIVALDRRTNRRRLP